MPDLPFDVPASIRDTVLAAVDREGKLDRTLDALGPLAGQDVVAIDPGERQMARWSEAAARLTAVPDLRSDASRALAPASVDVIVSPWAAFRGAEPDEIAEADRILRPHGRLLVIHDYGRDDLATLRGDQPEYGAWSRRDGPFLTNGFRVRVIHCFWTFENLDEARSVVAATFSDAGRDFADELSRPRLSWNVAVYHRARGGIEPGADGAPETAG